MPNDPAVILAAGGKNALSMHTNFDSAEGGMNDVLCKMLGLKPESALHEEHGVGCGYVCECDGMNVRECAQVQAVRSLLMQQKKAVRCF